MDFKLTLTAESPLSFSQSKPGGIFQRSLPYIPGSALRGTLAGQLLAGACADHRAHHFDPDCDFCRIFLGPEAAVFTNAYPVKLKGRAEGEPPVADGMVEVLPATAVSCKQKGGFQPLNFHALREDVKADPSHGVFDTLIDRLCWETLQPAGLVYSPTCPVCGGRVKVFGGFYVRHAHDGHAEHYHMREVDQRLLTRVAINRRRMVAEEGLLFSPYVISEVIEGDQHTSKVAPGYQPTTFVGHVWGLPERWGDDLARVTAVGGRASRGLGYVHVQAQELEAGRDPVAALQKRVAALNEAIKQAWEDYQKLGGNDQQTGGTYFTLTLRADAVLRTREGLPTMVFDAAMLEQATGMQAQLVRSYASYHYGGGWHSAWHLPKPAQVLTRAGSVYVFSKQGLTLDEYGALAELERRGIGELTPEGYGQVRVADAFHLKRRGSNE
jgi:CRISPR-associated protein Csx10